MIEKTVTYRTQDEIENLIRAFKECKLSRSDWTHQSHLIVALWFLFHYSQEAATNCIRAGIMRYNSAIGIETTFTSGYHETITLFLIRIISNFLASERVNYSIVDLANKVIQIYDNKDLPFAYYSRDLLMSWNARKNWVEPDMKSIG